MDESFPALTFPTRGLDLAVGYGMQQPGTTRRGHNVRTCEPMTDRDRGGSRPMLGRQVAQQIPTEDLIQHLNIVVRATTGALLDSDPIPDGPNAIDDPSEPGPPEWWGGGTITFHPLTGVPLTGRDLGTRNPGGPHSGPIGPFVGPDVGEGGHGGGEDLGGEIGRRGTKKRKRRLGGSGIQPNKNTVTPAPRPGQAPSYCFVGNLTVVVRLNAPDPYGWNGQTIFVSGSECRFYRPPTIPAPQDAQTFASVQAALAVRLEAVGRGNGPENDGYDVIGNVVTGPGPACPAANVGEACT